MTTPTKVTYADKPWVKNYDKTVAATLNYPNVPLHSFLTDTAKKMPDAPALITSAHVPVAGRLSSALSYRQLEEQSDALAAGLVSMGLRKGIVSLLSCPIVIHL